MTELDLLDRTLAILNSAGVRLLAGLSAVEFDNAEAELGITFSDEHRDLLSRQLPVGDGFPNWRDGDVDDLREQIDWQHEGVLFDVTHNAFWPASWGRRPATNEDALVVARTRLLNVPALTPLFAHRFLPSATGRRPAPVLSVYQTDVIYYGATLEEWAEFEFRRRNGRYTGEVQVRIPFWSDLVDGASNVEL